eukprot:scaffold212398_cov31-Tisochrysis_lutea.AAC.2
MQDPECVNLAGGEGILNDNTPNTRMRRQSRRQRPLSRHTRGERRATGVVGAAVRRCARSNQQGGRPHSMRSSRGFH